MDKALVFGTKDCRFESCQGQAFSISAEVPMSLSVSLRRAQVCPSGSGAGPNIHCMYLRVRSGHTAAQRQNPTQARAQGRCARVGVRRQAPLQVRWQHAASQPTNKNLQTKPGLAHQRGARTAPANQQTQTQTNDTGPTADLEPKMPHAQWSGGSAFGLEI